MDSSIIKRNPPLLITLAAAAVQGILLYWLHKAITGDNWPATRLPWLALLYSVSLFVPLTIHLLSAHWNKRAFLFTAGGIAVAFAYFGWHFGSRVGIPLEDKQIVEDTPTVVYGLSLGVLWLLITPFLRCRLSFDRWRCEYPQLFSVAWQNVIQLAEAAFFTGLSWLLLGLWAILFKMLGYELFKELFTKPAFIYPFTAVTFGLALYLTGSVERLVTVTREQILGMLKWLAPVAALILALFTPTLLFKLPDLVFHGERAIGAQWLLWLLTITVVLLNAGYQNGAVEKPYPKAVAFILRCVIPAMIVVALTALYALIVRAWEYGITVERVFAIIVALTALAYSVGYASAAVKRGPWLKGIERVNVGVALGVIAVLVLTLTPIASPYRLSASSQAGRLAADVTKSREGALRYLRFDAGRYGMDALLRLSNETHGTAKNLAEDAKRMLTVTSRWESVHTVKQDEAMAKIVVYPAGRSLELPLIEVIRADLEKQNAALSRAPIADQRPIALLVDLNEDSVEECAVITPANIALYTRSNGLWSQVNRDSQQAMFESSQWQELQDTLASGDFAPHERAWLDLRIGGKVIRWWLPNEELTQPARTE